MNPDKTRHRLTNLDRGTEYVVKMVLVNDVGQGPPSRKVVIKTAQHDQSESEAPGKPQILDSKSTHNEIEVSWKAPVGKIFVREYIIQWGKTTPHENIDRVVPGVTTYKIKNLQPHSQYYISLKAGNNAGQGVEDYKVARTTDKQPFTAELYPPLGVQITVLTATTLNVSWHDQDRKKGDYYYTVRYKTNAPIEPRVRFLNSSVRNCLIHGLRPHTVYEVR